jgi:putative flippase GtrA
LTWHHTLAFAIVGAIGIAVQVSALWLLAGRLGVPLLAATVLATEIAVLHNFVWHVFWTWADRPASASETIARLARFHVTNGLVSIIGNLLLMSLLVGCLRLHYLVANLLSVGVCALVNLVISNFWVFRPARKWAAAVAPIGAGEAR